MTKQIVTTSLHVLLRLLIDEIVEDLARSGIGPETRPAQSQVGLNISLMGKAHEQKETRPTLLGLHQSYDVDVTVNFLA
jgi:hypothetical protein